MVPNNLWDGDESLSRSSFKPYWQGCRSIRQRPGGKRKLRNGLLGLRRGKMKTLRNMLSLLKGVEKFSKQPIAVEILLGLSVYMGSLLWIATMRWS